MSILKKGLDNLGNIVNCNIVINSNFSPLQLYHNFI